MRTQLIRLSLLLASLSVLTGCSAGPSVLLDDQSPDVVTNTLRPVEWTDRGEEMKLDAALFRAGSDWRGVQHFRVDRDTQLLLSSDDVSGAPRGVSMTYQVLRNDIVFASGSIPELLVAPSILDLQAGDYRLEVRVASTYEYQNQPRTKTGGGFTIPRVSLKEVD